MNKQLSKKQRFNYFLINLISFASIFLILGLIVFQLVQTSIYQTVDHDLQRLAEDQKFLQHQLIQTERSQGNSPQLGKFDTPPPNNFQQQVILWSKDGEILNEAELGSRFYDFQNLKLSTDNLRKISSIQTKDSNDRSLQFRSITLPIENQDQVAYIQLLVNTDPIKGTVERFKQILIICMIIFGLLSIALSYFLSKWFMKPILISWEKQQEFVENASHELRTPLTIIQAKLEKLFTKPNHTILEESETIALSLDEVQRLSQLTSDLLLLARSDSNSLTLEKEAVKINNFLNTVLLPYQELALAEEKEFVIDLGEDQQLFFDKKRIHQLMIILLDNALKYTAPGEKITVFSSVKNNEWLIKISDTGIGIDEEKKAAVFERFYRGEESRNRKTGGYGIGLAIAKWIVDEHQGKIELTDTRPKGTTVILRFPVK
ncbi:two-component system, OmpR family, sensor histidine kinase CiaH [Enterococcus sp. DIV0840]|uniref:sensor histidine kinase n=1 Tax=Enterococcus TaxID=1350 RepID=UPI001A8DFD1C|nr:MULTISPECIES: HAMP domain-containing sensor histidine kinase [Enterococcus]MBO0435196.1 HAMP domain-containing histidine kinase [Enterococcus sp. DIV0849a]MBO0472792.1 HAMP domain-containing histidine kinase [Enterococcus ureasiticus]